MFSFRSLLTIVSKSENPRIKRQFKDPLSSTCLVSSEGRALQVPGSTFIGGSFGCRLFGVSTKYELSCKCCLLPTAKAGNVFTVVCLFTIDLMATLSQLFLVTAQSAHILLECFLVLKMVCSPQFVYDE